MAFGFTDWDGADGTIKPGSIKRASSSNDKVWGEENLTETKLPYGTFVAVNPDGGVMPLAAGKRIHGLWCATFTAKVHRTPSRST